MLRRVTTENVEGELVAYGGTARGGEHDGDVGLGSCTKRAQDEAKGFTNGDKDRVSAWRGARGGVTLRYALNQGGAKKQWSWLTERRR
jgi:hypothetical protein